MFAALIDEYRELSPPELDEVIAAAELARRQAETQLAAATSVITDRGSYRDHGYRSVRAYLKGTLNCSGSTANKIRKRGSLLGEHPEVGQAFHEGHIGGDQIDELARAHAHPRAGHRFAEFAPMLLDHAEHLKLTEFNIAVNWFISNADPDGSFDDQKFREDERSATVTNVGGVLSIFATGGSPLAGDEMVAVHKLAVEAEFEKDCEARRREFGEQAHLHPLPRTAQQRSFDALHQIFIDSVSVPVDAKAPEPLINLLFDHVSAGHAMVAHGLADSPNVFGLPDDVFAAAEVDLPSRRCETSAGVPVHPDVALRAMIAGRLRRVVVGADGVVIDLGRTQRLFTGKAREAAQLLVRSCTHPGCDVPATFCDVDHRQEWVSDRGSTDQSNAMPLCGVHDRWKHSNRLRTRRATNGRIYLIRPNGKPILAVGQRAPEWAESSPDTPARRPAS